MQDIRSVGILSDSHDNMNALNKAVTLFNSRGVDLVIHAGDLVAPFTAAELKKLNCPLVITFGNNDGEIIGLYKVFDRQIFMPPHELMVNEKKVLIYHDPLFLNHLASHSDYDVIIYGHLHVIDVRKGKPLIISPGECGGWLTGRQTVAIWTVANDEVEIIDL
ncbi:metallophosphoesterase [candidate division KSB1 bacterium]|nr:metallophosphoesterase [candidate division KSB1 bacterium]